MKLLVNVDVVKARESGFESQGTYECDIDTATLNEEDWEAVSRCHYNRELQAFGIRLTVAAPTPEAVLEAAREALVRIRRQDEMSKEWNNRGKRQLEQIVKGRSEKATALQRSVELAAKINRGELNPGLLFDDHFQLRCPSLLQCCVEDGIAHLTQHRYPPYPALSTEDKSTLESAIAKIREFQAAAKPMSATEDAAVLQPEPQDVEIMEALDDVSKIVLGEVNPATLFDKNYKFLGSATLCNWMLPGGKIEEHPRLDEAAMAVINQAAMRVFMARCRQPFRTDVEQTALNWLNERKRVAQLEDVLARLGTPHQQARYRAGLLNLYQEAKPLLEDELFAPLVPLNLALYTAITPNDVLEHEYGPGEYDESLTCPELWLIGRAVITDKATDTERNIMAQIQAALPGAKIVLFRHRLGLEGPKEGEYAFSRCRNHIIVTLATEGGSITRNFASPRGDY